MVEGYVCYIGKDPQDCGGTPCEACRNFGKDRRVADRRAKKFTLRLWERREGFDRRRSHHSNRGIYGRTLTRGATYLRDNHTALVLLLVVFNLLNIADYVFTLKALALGQTEGNPVMDIMFTAGPVVAAAFKITVGLFIGAVVWLLRRYRLVLETSIVIILMYMALIIYHIYGAIRYY